MRFTLTNLNGSQGAKRGGKANEAFKQIAIECTAEETIPRLGAGADFMEICFAACPALMRMHLKAGTAAIVGVAGVFFIMTILRNRDWQSDEVLYKRTLQVQPASAEFWNSLGMIYLDRKENQQARKCFNQASRYDSDARFIQSVYEKHRIKLGLGIVAARESRSAAAKAYLNKALECDPKGEGAYATLAAVLLNHGRDYAKALELLQKAIAINPVSELNRDYLGIALLNPGQTKQAIESFREALRLNPTYEAAQKHLQFALQRMKP